MYAVLQYLNFHTDFVPPPFSSTCILIVFSLQAFRQYQIQYNYKLLSVSVAVLFKLKTHGNRGVFEICILRKAKDPRLGK